MEIKFTTSEVLGILYRYYSDKEEKNITINISEGKVISPTTYMPNRAVVHFDVYKQQIENGEIIIKRTELQDEKIKTMIQTVLSSANFEVENIDYEITQTTPIKFLGISVKGKKIEPKKTM